MSTEIASPPFPGDGTNPDRVYQNLSDLGAWVNLYRTDLNDAVGRDVIPPIMQFPPKTTYLLQPISIMWHHFIVMRRIREEWDHLVRTYEDSWDCTACGRQRLALVQTAAVLINSAFVPFEKREAMREREVEQINRMWANLKETLLRDMTPKYSDAEPYDDTGSEEDADGG